ncbi:MAG: ATP-binding protein [Candidatus Binatia bacterium]
MLPGGKSKTNQTPSERQSHGVPSRSDPTRRDNRVLQMTAERVRLLYSQAPVGMVVTVFNSLVVAGVLWPVIPRGPIVLWAGSLLVVTSARYALFVRYRQTVVTEENVLRWRYYFIVGCGAAGVAWGAAGWFLFPTESLAHQFFLAFVLCGMAVGGVGVFAWDLRAFLTFFVPVVTPVTISLFVQEEPVYVALGSLAVVLCGALFILARYLHDSLSESLRLRFDNLALIQDLAAAKERAEEASKVKSEFLAKMSHEIRTPMNGVLGMTELLLECQLSERPRQLAETVQRSARGLLQLLNDILDVSKIETGKLDLECTDFALTQTVDEVTRLLAPGAVKKGVRLRCEIQSAVPSLVRGDSYRLRQVLTNLLGNAIKFTETGEIVVEVRNAPGFATLIPCHAVARASLTEGSGGYLVEFSVRDTGIGMTGATIEKVFEPFVQGDNSTTRKFGGTGLGLTISKQLVTLMGGEIHAESELGKGSRFFFTVPFAPSTDSVGSATGTVMKSGEMRGEPKTGPLLRRSEARNVALGAPHVLLVEDNLLNVEVEEAMLELLGCVIDVVRSGQDAVAAVARATYDLIFMDCQLPGMDGFAATQEIRRHERDGKHTPIVALTANVGAADRARCIAAGMDDYVAKPFTKDALAAVLARWSPPRSLLD